MASSAQDSRLNYVCLDDPSDKRVIDSTRTMPVIDVGSDQPLPTASESHRPPTVDETAATPPPHLPGEPLLAGVETGFSPGVWLSGDVLMCGCPECGAPMTIRQWLLVADCWSCGLSIELSEQWEQEAQRSRRERPQPQPRTRNARTEAERGGPSHPLPGVAPPVPPAPPAADDNPGAPRPNPSTRPVQELTRPNDRPTRSRRAPDSRPVQVRSSIRPRRLGGWLQDLLKQTPAWLISLVFHLVLLTLLGMMSTQEENRGPYITLSASVDRHVREGELITVTPSDDIAFDLPVPRETDLHDPQQRDVMIRADQDARELRLDPDAPHPTLPDLPLVKEKLSKPGQYSAALLARDPRLRIEVVKREGGTTLTEAAVARGLRWLAQQQGTSGCWELDGPIRSDSAATSLALMPFLGAGQTHLTGRYQDQVSRGLRWLIENQKPNGDLRADSRGNSGMYAHGQGAIVLCEAFLMTGDEELREPAQRAIDFIASAQYLDGGWRYEPHDPRRRDEQGDTSVLGWQLMALQSARAANLTVDPDTLERASHYLDSVQSHDGARYAYQRGRSPTHVMTAEALLCRIYLGWDKQQPGLVEGVKYLRTGHSPEDDDHNMYYWYYATQTIHHYGGVAWEQWNFKMRDLLVSTQETRGAKAGSWPPISDHTGGRLFETALAVCTLEVYYRHLPIFRQIQVD